MPYMPRIPQGVQCAWNFDSGYRCPGDPIHVIGFHDDHGAHKGQVYLCHDHFLLAAERGLVDEPYVGREEFRRRGGNPDA